MHVMTSDQSDQLMRWKMRSRRMPALLTRMSTRPKASSAAFTILSAFCGSVIESVEAIALPPACLDLVDHLLRRAGVAARAVERRADVVDHDARAFLRHQHRDGAPDAAPGAGDDGDFAGDDAWHLLLCSPARVTRSDVAPGLDAGDPRCAFSDLAQRRWIAGSSPAMTAVDGQRRRRCMQQPSPPPHLLGHLDDHAAASPIARPRSACCPPRSRQSRIAATGRAGRARHISPPRRCGA